MKCLGIHIKFFQISKYGWTENCLKHDRGTQHKLSWTRRDSDEVFDEYRLP